MSKTTAQIIFVILNMLAVLAVSYAIYDFVSIYTAIDAGIPQISFDSGTYYLFLASIFWIFAVIQILGKKGEGRSLKFASLFVVAWFVAMLLLANVLPYYLQNRFEQAGYTPHDNPREISRVAKGKNMIYIKSETTEGNL